VIPRDKLNQLETELHEMQELISDPAIISDARRYRDALRRFKELGEINQAWKHYQQLETHIEEVKLLLESETDSEMTALIKEEAFSLDSQLETAELKLRDLLIPSDPNDTKNAIVEVRAGTGGEEAAFL
jgi:peptide chain release factor 1